MSFTEAEAKKVFMKKVRSMSREELEEALYVLTDKYCKLQTKHEAANKQNGSLVRKVMDLKKRLANVEN